MAIDYIHDIQRAYRKVIRAMSYPGSVIDLSEEAASIEPEPPFNPVFMLLALTLLDGEVTFMMASGDAVRDARLIAEATYARSAAPGNSRFLFITDTAPNRAETLAEAPAGTLADPHLGATALMEVPPLESSRQRRPVSLVLSGPGIEDASIVSVEDAEWWTSIRDEKNGEYPLGIDIILIDDACKILALPRTTVVSRPHGPVV